MVLESYLEDGTLTSPGPWQPSDDTDSQKWGKQRVGTETRGLLPLAEPIFMLHIGNCVRSTGCTVLSVICTGKLHTNQLRPRGRSHPFLCLLISFACRCETGLVRKGTQTSVILPSGSTTEPSSQKSDIFIPLFVCFRALGFLLFLCPLILCYTTCDIYHSRKCNTSPPGCLGALQLMIHYHFLMGYLFSYEHFVRSQMGLNNYLYQ